MIPGIFTPAVARGQRVLAAVGIAVVIGVMAISAARAGDLVIAVPAPVSGANRPLGIAILTAANLMAAEINAAGGINGDTVVIEPADDPCRSGASLATFEAMAQSRAAAVIGHSCAPTAVAAAALYERAGKVFIAAGAHIPTASIANGARVFRLPAAEAMPGTYLGASMAAMAQRQPGVRLALVRDRTQLATQQLQAASAALAAAGVTPVLSETFAGGDKDFSTLAARLAAAGVTHVGLAAFPAEAALLIADLAKMSPGVQVLALDYVATPEFVELAGAAIDRVRVVMRPDVATLITYAPRAAALAKAMTDAGVTPTRAALYTAAAIEAFATAMRRPSASGASTADGIAASLKDPRGAETVLGPLGFDRAGNATLPVWQWHRWTGTGWRADAISAP